MQALWLTAAPTLREYVYQIRSIQVFVPATGYEPGGRMSQQVEHWIPETDAYVPDGQDVVLQPRAGTDNTYRIALSDDYWKRLFELFRRIRYTRHATVPEGMQIVEVEVSVDPRSSEMVSLFLGESARGGTFRSDNAVGKSVDVVVRSSRSPNLDGQQDSGQTLIQSAELIAIPDRDTLRNMLFGRGFGQNREHRTTPIQVSVLLTNEQVDAVVLAERKGTLTIRPTEGESSTPILDQEVFEKLQALPDKES
jgi:hypothetical protein